MAKTPKRPRDPNQLAKLMLDIAAGDVWEEREDKPLTPKERGKLGGQKGGKARAAKLSAESRTDLARKAAIARWDR